ncbi:MAG: SpoIIE family protein phosphatase [Victivallaceae bacterium]|nr:SpoIIE family protein phosphatase [Victivallaceae bacterium]
MELHDRNIKLLAVDNEAVSLLLLEETLKDEGVNIDCCNTGEKAIELIKRNNYEVVLSAIIMPGMDGFALRRRIREYDRYLPIIYLTTIVNTADNDLLEKIAADKATYYMKKPFERSQLVKLLRNVVQTHRSENQTRKYYNILEENLNLASEVQHLLLPDWIRLEGDLIMSLLYRSAYKVSGDIFEVIRISSGRYFMLLGDIAGHGIQAALYMSAIQALVKTIIMTADDDIRLDDILNRLNGFFCVDMQDRNYMTCLVALFDFNINRLQFISAGHPGFFMCDGPSGKMELLNPGNRGAIPVGWTRDYEFNCDHEAVEVDFHDDSIFFGITDGIIEISNEYGIGLGTERLRLLLEDAVSGTLPALVPYHVCDTIREIGYNVVEDDVCMVMIKKNRGPKSDGNYLHLATKPDIAHADLLGIECERFIIEKSCDEKLAVKGELLLNEFLNNIIIHGLGASRQEVPKIYVYLRISDSELVLTVCDRGKPWTFNINPAPLDERIWDDNTLATAGRGMAIIRSMVSRIEANRYGDLNETTFIIRREE